MTTINDIWCTPPWLIDKARSFLGSIDTDPASNAAAQDVVRAEIWYNKEDDGLTLPWHGRVWMNPPYSTPLASLFAAKLLREYASGRCSDALALFNNATETKWAQPLLRSASVCFFNRRIRFWRSDIELVHAPMHGQMLFYLGDRRSEFAASFADVGTVMQRSVDRAAPAVAA